ncbi:MAG: HemK/PrmC family methyltransferase [Verrucomicrobiia bacterium]
MHILDVISKTTPFFEKHGIESPRLNIELLLAHLLKKKRLDLYVEFERELDEATLQKLRELVKRRAAGEPLQYITGEAEFFGLRFAVDRRVLIPRPETELLVETVLERLKAEGRRQQAGAIAPTASEASTLNVPSSPPTDATERVPPLTTYDSPLTIIDVGTGSGCIAVALAKRLMTTGRDACATGEIEIWATDVSAEALEVAASNAARHEVEKNIRFLQGDLIGVLPDGLRADVIVSNPPYIATGELAKLPKEVRDFEPVRALSAGEDGLEVIQRLVMDAKRVLKPSGFVALEMGAGQRAAVEALFVKAGYEIGRVVKDLQRHERVIVAVPRL